MKDNDGRRDDDDGTGDNDNDNDGRGDILIAHCYLVMWLNLMPRQNLASNHISGGRELIRGGVQRHHHRQLWQSPCPCLRQVG